MRVKRKTWYIFYYIFDFQLAQRVELSFWQSNTSFLVKKEVFDGFGLGLINKNLDFILKIPNYENSKTYRSIVSENSKGLDALGLFSIKIC